ncbi:uncharacterized protein Dana_GF20031, isoform B [Drosophila ananassae]|nr:uncharacterized protein LOC6502759 isoform X2 [Drosophila ananassae]XP_044572564.1 uncharacterized protein LOC6502759 isoform X2 [Drosophila ananassae]XP_044572565.1 uncharacterized protein LOC6502759 isoform X2 [Drosophila ananassae]EDV32959.2 uncharacterized protein Dana_GF20031, isoform C [Drosophila ananassae]KPU74208.1 uncharacterized protein Dana_GF20031, isoform B [Drosophila ananassae]
MMRVHSRFLNIMHQFWRFNCKNMLIVEPILLEDLILVLKSTCNWITNLRFRTNNQEHFAELTKYMYPNVKDLRLATRNFQLKDSDMIKLVQSFPNIKTFSPQGHLTGAHMSDFRQLENLTLSYCSYASGSQLTHILSSLRLKSLKLDVFSNKEIRSVSLPLEGLTNLELLHCDSSEMTSWFLDKIRFLVNLKELKISDNLHANVARELLDSLSVNRSYAKSLELTLIQSIGLALASYCTIRLGSVIIISQDIGGIGFLYTEIPNTKRLYLKCCVIRSQNDFHSHIKALKTPEFICFDCCQFEFKEFTFSGKDIAQDRSTKLNLHIIGGTFNQLPINSCHSYEDISQVDWKVVEEDALFEFHRVLPKELKVEYKYEPFLIQFE